MNPNLIEATWKQGSTVAPVNLTGAAFQQEAGAHTFRITCLNDDGSAASVSGTVTAEVLRSDGVTRVVTGSISGNVVVVTLTSGCYECPGRVTISIKVTESASKTICVYQCHASVARTKSDTEYVDTGTRIPDLASLTQAEEDAEDAAQAANNAASAADTARLALQDTIDTQVNAAGYPYTATGASVAVHPAPASRIDFVAHIDPVQAGSGDPSPSNVRAITAPESVTVKRFGANLLNKSVITGTGGTVTQTDTGIKFDVTTAGTYCYAQYAGLTPHLVNGVTYTVSTNVTAVTERARLYLTGIGGTSSVYVDVTAPGKLSLTFTWDSSKYSTIRFYATFSTSTTASVTFDDIMMVQGEEVADYEPWAGWTSVTLTLPEGVYGGDYDSHGSFAPMRYGTITSGSRSLAAAGSVAGNLYIRNTLASDLTSDSVVSDVSRYFCSLYKPMPYAGIGDRQNGCMYIGNGAIYICDTAHMTSQDSAGLDAYFSWLDGVGGMAVCGPYRSGAAPTPTAVDEKTLRAASPEQLNHVWTDNGEVEVSGATDLKWLIDSLHPNG